MLLIVAVLPDHKTDRHTAEAEHRAHLIFKIPLIRKMKQLRIVAENDKGRRGDGLLRHIIDLEPAALIRRRLHARRGILKDVVEHPGGDAHGILVRHGVDRVIEPIHALTREGVRAASVLFDPGTKKPLFRLAYDQVGASQALDVAREHGLPESVLRRAEQYLLLDGQDMTAVMDRLNALAAKREGELDALKAEQQRTREKRKAVQERFERERERLIKDVRELSAKVMKDWQEGKAGHKQALKELAKVRAELHVSPEQEEAAAPAFDIAEIKPGQHVMHRPWNKKAVVREVDARQNRVKLDMNGVTLWADAALLGPADAPQQQAKPKSGVLVRTTAGSAPEMSLLRLDLRGKRADQALGELSQYLDRALLSGREGVEIVHGRGTGVLRKEVHAFLKTFPGIASFALAPEDQGGDGVTIVTFK